MDFWFDFDWKDYIPKQSFRTDKSDAPVHTTRVAFEGVISRMDQNNNSMHQDKEKAERNDFGEVKFSRDDNGRLQGRAVITTIGVYPYIKEDGTVQWELRHPDDVYDIDSLRTLELLPLTNEHPTERVDKDNVKDLQVGQFGENVMVDFIHGYVTNSIVVAESEAISDVEAGKRAVSMGYSCDVVQDEGIWNGIPYTARQTNIRYNHGSIVDRGRAGDAAVMKFDHFDGIQAIGLKPESSAPHADTNNDKGVTMGDKTLKVVRIDGVDYEAEPAVITALHKATEKNDGLADLEKKNDELNKQIASLQGKLDAAAEEAGKMKSKLDASVQVEDLEALFTKRQKLDEAVSLAKIEDADKMDAKAKMEAVVLAVSPGSKDALEARKDSATYDTYLESRFDAAAESLQNGQDNLADNLASLSGGGRQDSSDGGDGGEKEIKTDADMWNSLVNAHKKK